MILFFCSPLKNSFQTGQELWDAVVGLASVLAGGVLTSVAVALRVQLKKLGSSALARIAGGRRLGSGNPDEPPKPANDEQPKPANDEQPEPATDKQPKPVGSVRGQQQAKNPGSGNPFDDAWEEADLMAP